MKDHSGRPWGGVLWEEPRGPPFVCCHGLENAPALSPHGGSVPEYTAFDCAKLELGKQTLPMPRTVFRQRLGSLTSVEDKCAFS